MIRLVPFETWHLAALENRDGPMMDGTGSIKESGPSWTALADPGPVMCGGIVLPWPGMGICWMSLGLEAGRYGVFLTRTSKRLMCDVVRAFRLHRLEAVVLAGSERNCRWLEAMGFKREGGVARAYTPGKLDAIRYELVRE